MDSNAETNGTDPHILGEFSWSISDLARSYPPSWRHENKKLIAEKIGDDRATPGTIKASRWGLEVQAKMPSVVKQCGNTQLETGFFQYAPPAADDSTTHWHMNFADPVLFGYGEGPLLAQDELQIVEHPILASIAKAIQAGEHGQKRLTRQTKNQRIATLRTATPVLVQGAPRRCHFDTTAGLYGDGFARASKKQIEKAVRIITPPTISNIIALAALPPRNGLYTLDQISEIYETAFIGFRATVLQSGSVTLHTGHWGCGAFGGNKGLVAALTVLAAGAAGVDMLRYWYGYTTLDKTAVEHGVRVAALLDGKELKESLNLLYNAGYHWGDANENHVPYQPPENDLLQLARE